MTRLQLTNILEGLLPTYSVGQKTGLCTEPYLVVKYKPQIPSVSNSHGGWQYLEIMVYVPDTSIIALDGILTQVKTTLRGLVEITGNMTPDYHDQEVKAYMRAIEFRIPKEVM